MIKGNIQGKELFMLEDYLRHSYFHVLIIIFIIHKEIIRIKNEASCDKEISKKFSANDPFLYPLKTREKHTFSDGFRGYRKGILA